MKYSNFHLVCSLIFCGMLYQLENTYIYLLASKAYQDLPLNLYVLIGFGFLRNCSFPFLIIAIDCLWLSSRLIFLQNRHSHDQRSLVIILQDAENLLSQVKLSESAHIRAGSYSGGMKRRLSVAIALIGDPKLVFLDEPVFSIIPPCLCFLLRLLLFADPGSLQILSSVVN